MTDENLEKQQEPQVQFSEAPHEVHNWMDELLNKNDEDPVLVTNPEPLQASNDEIQVEISEATFPPISGGDESEIGPKREKKRKSGKMYLDKIQEKLEIAYSLASSSSEATEGRQTKAGKLDKIADHMFSLQQENETLQRKNEALQRENEMLKRNSIIEKLPSIDNTIESDILKEIEADDVSRVKLSDFNLDGEIIMVGKYSFPCSLYQTVNQINFFYGDVSATSKFNVDSNQGIYRMFCATIEEMNNLPFENITKDVILKWRDVINDALRMNFNVGFAKEHLRKIGKAYVGLMQLQKLNGVNLMISNLNVQLSAAKVEYSEIFKMSKVYIDVAEEFTGKHVSSGMFGSDITVERNQTLV